MARQPEYEDDDALSSARSSDSKDAKAIKASSQADLVRLKLKLISNYVLDGFAPFVAVIALIVAVIAVNGNKSGQAQFSQNAARMDSMSASLLASKAELEKLKAAMTQEKFLQQEANKKRDEQVAAIIQNISKLQVKMKISPTLEEQLQQPASASAVTPFVASAAPIPAKADVETGADKQPGAQLQILKEAINKFNKK